MNRLTNFLGFGSLLGIGVELISFRHKNFILGIHARDSYEIDNDIRIEYHTLTVGLGLLWFTFEFIDL